MADVLASYSESNQSSDLFVLYSGYTTRVAESWVNSNSGYKLYSAKFYLKKVGSPTGNAVYKLYSNSSGPNTVLATSDNIDVSTLSTSYQLVEALFTGDNKIDLNNSTTYWISCEYSGGSSSNNIIAGNDSTSPAYSGQLYYYFNGSWSNSNDIYNDLCFYVYGVSGTNYTKSLTETLQASGLRSALISRKFSPALIAQGSLSKEVFRGFSLVLTAASLTFSASKSLLRSLSENIVAYITSQHSLVYIKALYEAATFIESGVSSVLQYIKDIINKLYLDARCTRSTVAVKALQEAFSVYIAAFNTARVLIRSLADYFVTNIAVSFYTRARNWLLGRNDSTGRISGTRK